MTGDQLSDVLNFYKSKNMKMKIRRTTIFKTRQKDIQICKRVCQ